MSKKFEEYFSELQADMVSICLEYAEGRAEKIYIYGSCENNSLSSTCFYCINGITVDLNKLNDAIKDKNSNFRYDESDDRQLGLLDVLSDDMDKILELHEEYQMEMPTEIKMVYDVTKNSLKAEYSYEIKYSNIKDKLSSHVADEWFEEVQAENKNPDNVKYHTERLAILNRKDPEPEIILNWKIFDDFVLEEKASPEIIKKYKGKVNETVLEVWKRYGFGTILNGYLRFVNPDKYEEIMEDTTGKFESAIVVFTTAMGDMIVWEKNRSFIILNYRRGGIIGVPQKTFFLDLEEGGNETYQENFDWNPYPEAIKKYGKPAYDECFGYFPVLGAGGVEKVENLKKVKLTEYIYANTAVTGDLCKWLNFSMEVNEQRN